MAKAAPVYQLKITLAHIRPPVWRRVQAKDCSLTKLHEIIQLSMGWGFAHLWEFDIAGEYYGDDMDGDLGFRDPDRMKLSQLAAAGVKKFKYTYDFGDTWEHVIQIEKTLPAEPKVK